MTFVLDTNVVSALRQPHKHPQVAAWASRYLATEFFLTAPIIAEIERGVMAKERTDHAQGATLRRWFESHVLTTFSGRILPFDLEAARVLGRYRTPEHAPLDDALIAAIAEAHGMTVATRNVRHFRALPVRVVNPWDASGAASSLP